MKAVELLSPAGSYEGAVAAINAGADAIYIGGSRFGARAFAKNTDTDSMLATLEYAHINDRKVFLTLNTLLKDQEITEDLYNFMLPMYQAGIDGVIIQDLGVFSFLKDNFKGLPLHCSTQMTISDLEGAKFMTSIGADRVVLSRELSLEEIKAITASGIETECFVHGALCYCYSGQCLFSSIIGGRSGNRGRCAQPCRLPYKVQGRNNYVLSPKDICTIEYIPQLINAGIYSFKIEGRMKRAEYTAAVTSIYRKYIDIALESDKTYKLKQEDMQVLMDAGNRKGFSSSYYFDHNGRNMISFDKPDYDTGGEEFFNIYKEKYLDSRLKKKLSGQIILKKGSQAILNIQSDAHKVSLKGAEVLEAIKAPLDKERILKQLNKTGDSPFVFADIDIDMDPDIFMPVNELNNLRRQGLDLIKDKILEAYRRPAIDKPEDSFSRMSKDTSKLEICAYIESLDYLDTIIDSQKVKRVYINASCFKRPYKKEGLRDTAKRLKGANIEAYFAFPHILRADYEQDIRAIIPLLEEDYDGVLIRNIDQLGFIKSLKFNKDIVADYSLYSYNRYSYSFLKEQDVKEFTAPVELNYKELRRSPVTYDEIYAYGYLPLMISAQCLVNTLSGCNKKNSLSFISDRYNKSFGLKSFCDYCYSLVYNSSPTYLADKLYDISKLGIKRVRLAFTNESTSQAAAIIKSFKNGEKCGFDDFTRGHFNRGVE